MPVGKIFGTILGEQTLPSSKICLEEYCGMRPWREGEPKKTG